VEKSEESVKSQKSPRKRKHRQIIKKIPANPLSEKESQSQKEASQHATSNWHI
jgi:hypothetical protein